MFISNNRQSRQRHVDEMTLENGREGEQKEEEKIVLLHDQLRLQINVFCEIN